VLGILSCSDNEIIVPARLDEFKENIMTSIDEMNPNCLSASEIRAYMLEDNYIYEVPGLCWQGNVVSVLLFQNLVPIMKEI